MKYLYLIRHAKASDDYNRINDFDRPLKSKGILQAHQMSEKLIKKNIKPDAILSSTASRALQTAHIFALKNELKLNELILDKNIYESTIGDIINSISQVNNQIAHLFLFGHNPSITHVANYLLDSIMSEIPLCGVVAIEIQSDTWTNLLMNKNHLIFFDIPDKIEDSASVIKPENNAIEIATTIEIKTENINPDASKI
jgi:phosphohistidine phosphatase